MVETELAAPPEEEEVVRLVVFGGTTVVEEEEEEEEVSIHTPKRHNATNATGVIVDEYDVLDVLLPTPPRTFPKAMLAS